MRCQPRTYPPPVKIQQTKKTIRPQDAMPRHPSVNVRPRPCQLLSPHPQMLSPRGTCHPGPSMPCHAQSEILNKSINDLRPRRANRIPDAGPSVRAEHASAVVIAPSRKHWNQANILFIPCLDPMLQQLQYFNDVTSLLLPARPLPEKKICLQVLRAGYAGGAITACQ
ncbi:hypothetical protein B0T16DRAFT_91314 [Cercophora newfieldiana]|uniref:Uncharacterized protein n=1 Tax=Cercophora newfieldiana TaxID=92897 RepID=A0AA39YG10_9PEZI|nr:hypothetical protein B0T16DRAFT_91314 [Cercophora newfieldiana]